MVIVLNVPIMKKVSFSVSPLLCSSYIVPVRLLPCWPLFSHCNSTMVRPMQKCLRRRSLECKFYDKGKCWTGNKDGAEWDETDPGSLHHRKRTHLLHCCLSPSIQLSQLNWTIVGPEKKILHYLDCFIKVLAISNHPTLIFNHFLKKYGRVSVVEPIKTLHLYKQI